MEQIRMDTTEHRSASMPPLTTTLPVQSRPVRVRSSSYPRIRCWPTREGLHFAFLITFILVGAIIRDVNLLVILAGVLIAMMILQGRLAARTLYNLHVQRRVPNVVHARAPFRVPVTIENRRGWIASWMVIVHDCMQRVQTDGQAENITICDQVDQVLPRTVSSVEFECRLPRRGLYQFGPMTLSTYYPLGLIQAKVAIPSHDECVVLPAIGECLPAWRELFRIRRTGANVVRARSAAGEGEFYGLRDYRVGDSPRWIHWRTSARRNELAVRQFEKQDSIECCLLLDLWRSASDGNTTTNDVDEIAIEMAATLVTTLIERARGSVSIAIAASHPGTYIQMRSRLQLDRFLRHLAMIDATSEDRWLEGFRELQRPLRNAPLLLVLSNRECQWNVQQRNDISEKDLVLSHTTVRWIDLRQDEYQRYFVRGNP